MKILHVFKTYYPDTFGGVEEVIFQLAEGGIKHGIDAEVFYLSKDGIQEREYHNHKTHSAKLDLYIASTGFSLSAIKEFKRLVKEADIIHYHFPWPFMDLLHILAKVRKPTVMTYHSDVVKQKKLMKLYAPLMMKFLKQMDSIVATSPKYLETSPVLQNFTNKVSVIPIGLQPYPVEKNEHYEKIKARLPTKFFLFIGALRYYKGVHILLDALKDLDYPTIIIGSGGLGTELKNQANDNHLQNIRFISGVSDMDKHIMLSLCYGVVFPSHLRSEAFGITLVEGLMHGKPLISCEIGTGTSYINQNEITGYVIPPVDVSALKDVLIALWDNESLAMKYGENALARYHELFTADKMVNSYNEVYRKIYNH